MTLPEVCRQCGKLAYPGNTVTIPSEEYEELLQFRRAREVSYVQVSQMRRASRSKIARDPELAQFIARHAETMLIKELFAACLERFGAARAPSKSSIHRFLHQV